MYIYITLALQSCGMLRHAADDEACCMLRRKRRAAPVRCERSLITKVRKRGIYVMCSASVTCLLTTLVRLCVRVCSVIAVR